ncbi:hypothetical protein ADL00_05055 [Streptomyces sp. AS58]|nr:hypothetical protein ADL00_05055 [Streptomyces sp. AS58]
MLVRRAGLGEIPAALGSSIGGALMENADYMMFTGSTASGRKIARDAGERLIGASLELGGKNAMLVLDDADIEKAADGAIAACFPSAGQLCVSIERLYVAEAVHDRFVAAFVARTEKLKLGGAYDYSCDIGSLTTPSQLETVTAHVDATPSPRARPCSPTGQRDRTSGRCSTNRPSSPASLQTCTGVRPARNQRRSLCPREHAARRRRTHHPSKERTEDRRDRALSRRRHRTADDRRRSRPDRRRVLQGLP